MSITPGEISFEPDEPEPESGPEYLGYELDPPGAESQPAPPAGQQHDPDRISALDDAMLPGLEAMLRDHSAVAGDLGRAISEMAAVHKLWYDSWLGQGFSTDQAFELTRTLVKQQFRS